MVGVGDNGPLVHSLCSIVVTTNGLKKDGVIAKDVSVGGVGGDSSLIHFLRPIIVTVNGLEEDGVVTETTGVCRVDR